MQKKAKDTKSSAPDIKEKEEAMFFGNADLLISYSDFLLACQRVKSRAISEETIIGELNEKSLHAALKLLFSCGESSQEIKIGTHYADVLRDDGIFEIQTRSLFRLKPKLTAFLLQYPVTVVYPIVHKKRTSWIDPDTGELIKETKSTRKGSFYHGIKELSSLADLIGTDGLSFLLLLVDIDEIKLRDGYGKDKKRRATIKDKLPTDLAGAMLIKSRADCKRLLPPSLPPLFSSEELRKALGIHKNHVGYALSFFQKVGLIEQDHKEGRRVIYRKG